MRAINHFWALAVISAVTAPMPALAQDAGLIERGLRVSIIGGCHDCHTEGYSEAEGKIDPEKALKGSSLGWRGPWGTIYASNLRIIAERGGSEDDFVQYLKTTVTRPPMPWYNLRAMERGDMEALYHYIKSLGAPGDPPPRDVRPGEEPTTPYIQFAPPQMPKS
jgi:cytochrome c